MSTRVQQEVKRLHDVAEKGESAETPAILITEVVLFLFPFFLLTMAIVYSLYYALGGPA